MYTYLGEFAVPHHIIKDNYVCNIGKIIGDMSESFSINFSEKKKKELY